MAPTLTATQARFVNRYLDAGIAPDGAAAEAKEETPEGAADAAAFARDWDAVRAKWEKAEEKVGDQVAAMQAAFRKSGAPQLQEIANFGLPALTGNTRSKAIAAMMDVDRIKSAPNPKILAKADKRFAEISAHLKSDPRVKAVDSNPFGLKVSIAASLCGAIDEMRSVLRQAVSEQS